MCCHCAASTCSPWSGPVPPHAHVCGFDARSRVRPGLFGSAGCLRFYKALLGILVTNMDLKFDAMSETLREEGPAWREGGGAGVFFCSCGKTHKEDNSKEIGTVVDLNAPLLLLFIHFSPSCPMNECCFSPLSSTQTGVVNERVNAACGWKSAPVTYCHLLCWQTGAEWWRCTYDIMTQADEEKPRATRWQWETKNGFLRAAQMGHATNTSRS